MSIFVNTQQQVKSRSVPSSWRRVSILTPKVAVGDTTTNLRRISELYKKASLEHSLLVVTPELSLTGYSLGDGFLFDVTAEKVIAGLTTLAKLTAEKSTVLVVGAPLLFENSLYNCAVILAEGTIKGIVPKVHLPNYGEFYEKRWFKSGKDITNSSLSICGQEVPFGTDLIFLAADVKFGVEICEDVWVADPPSRKLAEAGAELICNLSASPEIVGKDEDRRNLITQTAARLRAGYVYVSADASESTSDIIMSGHGMISEFDTLLAERPPLAQEQRLLSADIDMQRIRYERLRDKSWISSGTKNVRTITCTLTTTTLTKSSRIINPHPFTPSSALERAKVANHILNLQAHGLKKRMEKTATNGKFHNVILGLSGGLDSTLALLVAIKTCDLLGIPHTHVHTLTMPAEASSARTQDNASLLARTLGTTHEVIAIQELVDLQLRMLGHDGVTQDIAFENTQARTRTELLFNRANQVRGLVLGTGDLSELALGWCTYNGDHMSNYAVNAGVPKTLVRYIVDTAADQEEFIDARTTLKDILATPVSPELTGDGTLSQETEDIVGPYELHDFFIYHLLRRGCTKSTLKLLASRAFYGTYSTTEIEKWLSLFCKRFVTQQFKRNCIPDGVKVGRITLSPRGDFRFPSDAELQVLLAD